MSDVILVPVEIGRSQDRPHFTVDGFKQLVRDLTKQHGRKPSAIILNEYDRRELNQEVMSTSKTAVSKEDQRESHDGAAIGYIDGVAFVSERGQSRGSCRPVFGARQLKVENKLGGEGLIIVGA
jgi:hypothetical protein